MISDRYRLSFTTGSLFLQEAIVVTGRYLALRDWKITREQVRSDNLIQVRTQRRSRSHQQEVDRPPHLSGTIQY